MKISPHSFFVLEPISFQPLQTPVTGGTKEMDLGITVESARWATKKKTFGYIPRTPGCLMTGSFFHGLWNNPHITEGRSARDSITTQCSFEPKNKMKEIINCVIFHPPNKQPGALFSEMCPMSNTEVLGGWTQRPQQKVGKMYLTGMSCWYVLNGLPGCFRKLVNG